MPFPMQEQTEDQWCWAAVAVSVNNYFFPGSKLTQCQMASAVFKKNCCAKKHLCDWPAKLQRALEELRNQTATGSRQLTFPAPCKMLSFDEIETEIKNCLPVCVRIGWADGGGHFVVIYGCERSASGEESVDVADPLFGDSNLDYREFSYAYLGSGQWTNTFPVRVKEGQ
jgi:hypothetical protein